MGGILRYLQRWRGSYARVEPLDADFTSNHFPSDRQGNLYQVRDDEITKEEGDLRFEGESADAYRDTYFKQTNSEEDTWDDLIKLTANLNAEPGAGFLEEIEKVANLDQWMRYLAVDALLGNLEGGLTTAKGDDYALYRGIDDPRFHLVPHDLDSLLTLGSRTPNPSRNIWVYEDLAGFQKLFRDSHIVRRYLRAHLELLDEFFTRENLDPVIDSMLEGWRTTEELTKVKEYVTNRRNGVRAQHSIDIFDNGRPSPCNRRVTMKPNRRLLLSVAQCKRHGRQPSSQMERRQRSSNAGASGRSEFLCTKGSIESL